MCVYMCVFFFAFSAKKKKFRKKRPASYCSFNEPYTRGGRETESDLPWKASAAIAAASGSTSEKIKEEKRKEEDLVAVRLAIRPRAPLLLRWVPLRSFSFLHGRHSAGLNW